MNNAIKQIQKAINHVPIKKVELSENESLNDVYQKHGNIGIVKMLQQAEHDLEEVEPVAQLNIVQPNSVIDSDDEDVFEKQEILISNKNKEPEKKKYNALSNALHKEQERNIIFNKIHNSLLKGLKNVYSKIPQKWLADKALSSELTGAGFNAGQFHNDCNEGEIKLLIEINFRKYSRKNSNGVDGYKTFGNYGILFPLKNRKGNIVNFYAIRLKTNPEEHSMLNGEGIYPAYPQEMATRLFITTDMIDSASVLESRVLQNRDAVIFIPSGKLLQQHLDAISRLTELQTIIWIFNNDKHQVNMKNTTQQLKSLIQRVPLRRVVIPENDNLNQIYLREGSTGIQKLLDSSELIEEVSEVESTPLPIMPIETIQEEEVVIFSPPKSTVETSEEQNPALAEKWEQKANDFLSGNSEVNAIDLDNPKLDIIHEHKIVFRRTLNNYYVLGSMTQDIGSLRITLMVEEVATERKERTKIDLYEKEQVLLYAQQISELYNQATEEVETDIALLTDLLEKFREAQLQQSKTHFQSKTKAQTITPEKQSDCVQFLRTKNFMKGIDELIQQAGVVGEESTRRLLFVIASTYKMSTPLHALVQGTSGSGKSHLINTIGECFPPEDVISMTRVTSKSFYHYTKDELVDKLLLIQDYDGLDEEAQFAFRELQSAGNISSSTTYKDRYGNLMSAVKTVRSHFASLLATTKAEVYYDNMSRSMITGVDESDEQTKQIITHQNRKLAGIIDSREERKAKEFLQNCMRCIQPLEVVNPYADKVYLPIEAKMLRRLNSHYQAFVKQITILHQYQRKKDDRGRLIAEPEDLKLACEILFDAIMLKVDDLDSSLRQFYDRLKAYIIKVAPNQKEKEFQFTQRDVRLALNISKTQCFRYFEELELLEYIQRSGGYSNRGFKYKIVFWDEMNKMRDKIQTELNKQLDVLTTIDKTNETKKETNNDNI